jgi:hypothetical protein
MAVVFPAGAFSQKSTSRPPEFLFRAVETQSTLHPTAGPNNLSNCVVVRPDGHFYLLLHRQEIMDGTATVKSFEGLLDEKAMQVLRGLLDDDAIKQLSPFVAPEMPFPSDTFQAFVAEVTRGPSVQHIGYFSRTGDGPRNPESVKRQWQHSEATVQPLVDWFRGVKTSKYPIKRRVPKSWSTMCDITP